MTINRRRLIVLGSLGTVLGVGWIGVPRFLSKSSIDVAGFPPLRYPGFQTWPTLRDFDGPGTVFSIADGTLDIIGMVAITPTLVGDEFLGELRTSRNWKANILEKFLGSTFQLNATSNAEMKVDFEPTDVQRWRIIPNETKDDLKKFAKDNKNDTVFVITESISLKGITYILDEGSLVDVKPTIRQNASGTIEMRQSDKDERKISIIYKFTKPFYLFYRPQKINVLSGLAESQLLLTDSDEDLRWSRKVRSS